MAQRRVVSRAPPAATQHLRMRSFASSGLPMRLISSRRRRMLWRVTYSGSSTCGCGARAAASSQSEWGGRRQRSKAAPLPPPFARAHRGDGAGGIGELGDDVVALVQHERARRLAVWDVAALRWAGACRGHAAARVSGWLLQGRAQLTASGERDRKPALARLHRAAEDAVLALVVDGCSRGGGGSH